MVKGNIDKCDYQFKYIIIGDAAVGKSNLLLRYIKGQFESEYQLTMCVEYGSKNIEIKNKIYKIQIWDTAGQECFWSITRSYYKNSACAIIFYDISRKDSFNNLNNWIEACKNQCDKKICLVLVGNKSDLNEKREVSFEEGQELAEKYGMLFYETSAKDGTNVESIFNDSGNKIAQKLEEGFYDLEDDSVGIVQGNNEQVDNNTINNTSNRQSISFQIFKKKKSKKKCCK